MSYDRIQVGSVMHSWIHGPGERVPFEWPMDTARTEIISYVDLTPEALGIPLPGSVRAFNIRLDKSQGVSDNHFIVCAYYPPLDRDTCELMAERLCQSAAYGFISFMMEDAKGSVTVISGLGQKSALPFEVAAAVAIVKVSGGWDESNPILITVNGVEMAIRTHFDGSGWIASWSGQ